MTLTERGGKPTREREEATRERGDLGRERERARGNKRNERASEGESWIARERGGARERQHKRHKEVKREKRNVE